MNFKLNNGIFLLVCLVILFDTGCAVTVKKNRRLLNTLDKNIQIKNTTGKVVAAPIFISVGTVAGVCDMVFIHPVASMPAAANKTNEYLWKNPKGSSFRQMMLLLPKIIITPLFFTGNLTMRTCVPMN